MPLVPDRGSIGLRYTGFRVPLSIEGRLTFGSESGEGSICGGFVLPGSCVLEPIRYTGGSFVGSLGLELRRALGDRGDFRARPSVGLGAVWSGERGRETGKEFTDLKPAVSIGVSAEAGLRPWAMLPAGLAVFYRVEQVKPGPSTCEDCMKLFRGSLARQAFGIVVRW